jgi:SNF family Na+-dependent transporter
MAREKWGSRIGMILAMSGSAIGLGNFVRFPSLIAKAGGSFMIPYFIALFLLGLPVLWTEWIIGRYGGMRGHGSLPMIFSEVAGKKWAKYLGSLGLLVALIITSYYIYVVSWGLGYSVFSASGSYFGKDTIAFLNDYTGGNRNMFLLSYLFYVVVLLFAFLVLTRGISGGIERMAKVAMPLLIIFAIILTVRVLTLGPRAWEGLTYIWRPNWDLLKDWNVWLMAAGQIFFTLSLGDGEIPVYASYIGKDEDIAEGPILVTLLNEIDEVIFGGCIAIPAIFFFFGSITTEMTEGYNLAFIAMPKVVEIMPGGRAFGVMWFLLLFLAGFTTIISMLQTFISFLEDEFKASKLKSVAVTLFIVLLFSNLPILFYHQGVFDDMDFWAGSLLLVVVSLLEVIVLAWYFGMKRSMEELNRGGRIRIPYGIFYIIKYITPAFLIFLLVGWIGTSASQYFEMSTGIVWAGRMAMIALFILIEFLVYSADSRDAESIRTVKIQ